TSIRRKSWHITSSPSGHCRRRRQKTISFPDISTITRSIQTSRFAAIASAFPEKQYSTELAGRSSQRLIREVTMQSCSRCLTPNIPANWQFCPFCGGVLSVTTFTAPEASLPRGGALKQMVIKQAVDYVERFIQGRLQTTLSPIEQVIESFTGRSSTPV